MEIIKLCNNLKKGKPPRTCHLSQSEHQAMRKLQEDNEILVLPADKGNVTVVMNKLDYREQILSNCYRTQICIYL